MDQTVQQNAYIYGITIKNELVYIGKTHRKIDERLREHALKNGHNEKLEEAMNNNDYNFVILYESHNVISDQELCQIERALIENIRPKYNVLGVNKPYIFFAKKSDYTNGIKRNYKGMCQNEIDFMLDNNPFLCDSVGGSMSNIAIYYYQQGILSEPTIKAFKTAFGEPNHIGENEWINHGEKGFCVKGIMVRGESGMRYLTYPEVIGLQKVPKEEKCYAQSVYAFMWEDDLKAARRNYYQRFTDSYGEIAEQDDMLYFLFDRISDLNQMENYEDLDARMSYVLQPRFYTHEDGESIVLAPDRLRFN